MTRGFVVLLMGVTLLGVAILLLLFHSSLSTIAMLAISGGALAVVASLYRKAYRLYDQEFTKPKITSLG